MGSRNTPEVAPRFSRLLELQLAAAHCTDRQQAKALLAEASLLNLLGSH